VTPTTASRLLCLDTSTTTARVAVLDGAGAALAAVEATADRHSTHVLQLVDQVLRAAGVKVAELDAIACGAGPGSFTGLRVGLAVCKGLALAADKPLLLISSLEALAHDMARALAAAAPAGGWTALPCIDAGKGEVYALPCAVDAAGAVRAEGEPWRLPPAELVARAREIPGAVVAGPGAGLYAELLDANLSPAARRADVPGPSALSIGALALARLRRGETDDLDAAVPAYGRPPDITMKKARGPSSR
jgi:tRNA threonylcarbamoyladenosine biosynthesis protein TsaB